MSIYDRNLNVLESRYPDIVEILNKAETDSLSIQPARVSGLTLRTSEGITLHSRVDPFREAQDLVHAKEIVNGGRWMIFGIGLGYHLAAAMRLSSGLDELIAIDYCPDIVRAALENVDLTDLLAWKGFKLWLPGGIIPLEQRIIDVAGEVEIAVHPASLALWRRRQLPISDVLDLLEIERMNWKFSGAAYQDAVVRNEKALAACENVESYFKNVNGRPVLVVGAGPSLDDAKPLIKKYRSSLFVLAVNAAFIPLRNAGIKPDAVICVEPRSAAKASFDRQGEENIPLLFVPGTNPDVVEQWKGPKLVASDSTDGSLHHTGTVAGAALDVAIRLGGNPIILAGVDLALTGSWYAKDVVKQSSEAAGKMTANIGNHHKPFGTESCTVIGIDGSPVPSTKAFQHFILTLERLIEHARREHPNLKIFDLKDRGALIGGTEPMSPINKSMDIILGTHTRMKRSQMHTSPAATGVNP